MTTDKELNAVYVDEVHTLLEEIDPEVVTAALVKAARALRGGETVSLNGEELDIIRHLMPAHAVHQSGAARWVSEFTGASVPIW